MKIAIQGELGSFSHEAAEAMLKDASTRVAIVPCARSLEVFDRLQRGKVDGAVIPIENSLAGSVAEHLPRAPTRVRSSPWITARPKSSMTMAA